MIKLNHQLGKGITIVVDQKSLLVVIELIDIIDHIRKV